jgi:hypothetical protein
MIRSFHEARRHEEGQALVLAAISMLILAMCVLATINITYAAKERIQLQNAADAAAYTTAAYEARALNFLAYTNRAMVVQYVAQMNLMAILSNFYFNMTVYQLALQLLSLAFGPFSGLIAGIFTVIGVILMGLAFVALLAIAIAMPVLDAYSFGLSLAQASVVSPKQPGTANTLPWELNPSSGGGIQSLVSQYNSSYVVTSLSQTLLGVDESYRGYATRWGPQGTIVDVNQQPVEKASDEASGEAAYDRMQMIEIVNSARSGWVAHGKTYSTGIMELAIPRSGWGVGKCPATGSFAICLNKTARTEWGALEGGLALGTAIGRLISGVFGNLGSPTDEMFSLDRFEIGFSVLNIHFGITLDSWAYADRSTPFTALVSFLGSIIPVVGALVEPSHKVAFASPIDFGSCGLNVLCYLAEGLASAVMSLFTVFANNWLKTFLVTGSWLPLYHYGMMPYAKFRPASYQNGPGSQLNVPAGSGLFNQPPVLLMVTAPTSYLTAPGKPFLGPAGGFGFKIGQFASSGTPIDAAYASTRNKSSSARGATGGYVEKIRFNPGDDASTIAPGSVPSGLHAMSAAMAYYHRPGDWREPPNLFNPQWGAKLMPVVDYPTITQNAAMSQLITNNLLAH